MNSEFMLSQGAGQKLEFAVKRCGGTTEDIEYLSTGENFRAVSLLRTGKAKLVEITETESGGVVIPTALTPVPWTVDDEGNIYFTLISNGLSSDGWCIHLKSRGFYLSEWGCRTLHCASEAPTTGVTYNIVIRPGSKISALNCVTKKIRAHATSKGWKTPHWEVACLIRDIFTDEQLIKEMGLSWIVTMHKPIVDSGSGPSLLRSGSCGRRYWFGADCGGPDEKCGSWGGFAFIAP